MMFEMVLSLGLACTISAFLVFFLIRIAEGNRVMTHKQARLCRMILRYKTLDRITLHCGMSEGELEEKFKPGQLDFEDDGYGKTKVTLRDDLQELYEDRQRTYYFTYGSWFLSIMAIVLSVISIFLQIVMA